MSLLFFLLQAIGISLSGVMAPGPVTAAAVAMGARSRYAGALIAIGHGIVEFPLMILIILGMGKIFESVKTQIIIGLAGGVFLLIMAVQILISLKTTDTQRQTARNQNPVLTGVILSVGNPYFLIWWATIGLALATTARGFGIWAFGLFAIAHWLCDFVWLSALSWASFKGTKLLGPSSQRIVLLICSLFLFAFGLFFIYKAADALVKLF